MITAPQEYVCTHHAHIGCPSSLLLYQPLFAYFHVIHVLQSTLLEVVASVEVLLLFHCVEICLDRLLLHDDLLPPWRPFKIVLDKRDVCIVRWRSSPSHQSHQFCHLHDTVIWLSSELLLTPVCWPGSCDIRLIWYGDVTHLKGCYSSDS